MTYLALSGCAQPPWHVLYHAVNNPTSSTLKMDRYLLGDQDLTTLRQSLRNKSRGQQYIDMLYLAFSDCAQPPRHVLYHAVDEPHIVSTRVGTDAH
jgi:hypothetical protein